MASQASIWDKTKTGGKAGWNRLYALVDKLGPPVNKLSNKLGSEAFWPTSMDKECDKAARILRSFCKDGFYTEEETNSPDGPKQKQKVLKKIPQQVIQNAQGLAIFTTMRTGLWLSGSGGSGVLVARKADGSWSPPSGIQVQTMGLGFLVGIDIYDCVLVINSQKALEAFTRFRATIGGDLSVTAGPVGAGGILESEIHKRQAPIFTYLKSRGFYAGVAIDGTVVIERVDENERFYGERIPAQDILKGKVRHPPLECRGLMETLKAAEGDETCDANFIPDDLAPSDYEIQQEQDDHVFSVPDKDDPDPYGVLQLEKEGLVIREAGTQKRASWDQFTFAPAVTSPLFDTFDKANGKPNNIRASLMSRRSSGMRSPSLNGPGPLTSSTYARSSNDSPRTPTMSDAGTQTDDLPPMSPGQSSFRWGSAVGNSRRSSMEHILEDATAVPSQPRSTRYRSSSGFKTRTSSDKSRSPPSPAQQSPDADGMHTISLKDNEEDNATPPALPPRGSVEYTPAQVEGVHEDEPETHEDESVIDNTLDHEDDHDDDLDEEEPIVVEAPVVHSVSRPRAVATQVISRARVVEVPKRGPPPSLPARNPNRNTSGPIVVNGDRRLSQTSVRSSATFESIGNASVDNVAAEVTTPTVEITPPEAEITATEEKKEEEETVAAEPAVEKHEEPPVVEKEPETEVHAASTEKEEENHAAEDKSTEDSKPAETPETELDESPSEQRDPWKGVLARHESVDGTQSAEEGDGFVTPSGGESPELPGSFH